MKNTLKLLRGTAAVAAAGALFFAAGGGPAYAEDVTLDDTATIIASDQAAPESTAEPVTETTPEPTTDAAHEAVAETPVEPKVETKPEPITETTAEPTHSEAPDLLAPAASIEAKADEAQTNVVSDAGEPAAEQSVEASLPTAEVATVAMASTVDTAKQEAGLEAAAPSRLAAAPPRAQIPIPDVSKYLVDPTCTEDGYFRFVDNEVEFPLAQNPHGWEFPGEGYRIYLNRDFNGPGEYTATVYRISAGSYDAVNFPYGTDLVPSGFGVQQVITVKSAIGSQSDDPSADCYVDVTRPVVEAITGGCISGPITISATDEYALKRVVGNIYDEAGTKLIKSFQASASGKSGSLTIDPTTLPPGKYTLKYNAEDMAGNISTTRTVAIKTDCERPVVTVDTSNAKCMGSVTATFDDGKGILDYAVINLYQVDDSGKSTFYKTIARQDAINSSTATLTASLAGLPMGKYLVKAGAFDVSGNNGTVTSTSFEVTCPPEPIVVTPEAVTWVQTTCAAAGTYTVPVTVGGTYKDSSDQVIAAGSYPLPAAELVITFVPDAGNTLADGATSSWTVPAEIAATGCTSNGGGNGSNGGTNNNSGGNTGTNGGSTGGTGVTPGGAPTTPGVPGPPSTGVPVGNPVGQLPAPIVAPAAQQSEGPSSVLAFTGANLLPISLIAGLLIAAGSAFVIVRNRRRQSA